MPIILNTEPEKVERLEIGDSAILYTRASGDAVNRAFASAYDPETGEPLGDRVMRDLLASHIKGWENVVDAAGNPVPYSDEFAQTFVGALNFAHLRALEIAVLTYHTEAAASGKGSPDGSNGTG